MNVGEGMERRRISTRVLWSTVLVGLIVTLWPGALAASTEEDRAFSVGKWAFKRLNQAQQLFGKKSYADALKVMDSMRRRKRLNDHERALMWQTYGYIWSADNRLSKAIDSFERCLALRALPEGAALNIQFNLGQLYLATKRYKRAASTLASWRSRVKNPSPGALYTLSLAHAQNRQYRKALYFAQQAVRGGKLSESQLQLLLSLSVELKHRWEVVHVLQQLIERFPKKHYWLQLAAVYAELKQEARCLAVLELAHLQGLLNRHGELMNLVSLYRHLGIPRRAALVLERGLAAGIIRRDQRSLTVLADSWLNAREPRRALVPLSRAARRAKSGDLYQRIAQIQLGQQRWGSAAGALSRALKKGRLKDPGNAYLLLGIARYNLEQIGAAKGAFNKARRFQRTRRSAEQWIKLLRTRRKET